MSALLHDAALVAAFMAALTFGFALLALVIHTVESYQHRRATRKLARGREWTVFPKPAKRNAGVRRRRF